jgi:hypothetical protein
MDNWSKMVLAINFIFYFRVKNGFDKLSAEIQKKLMNAQEFATATVNELKQVPQDVLCALKVNNN